MKKNVKLTTFDKIARIVYAGFFAFFIFFITLSLVVPHGMIKVFGVGYYRVTSASMEPTIMVNDYVLARRVKVSELEEGDIILFNTKRQIGNIEMVEKIFVIHYFGYIDDEGHIFTYQESKKDLASNDPLKYDEWGTPTRPYYVTSSDLIGRHYQTIKSNEVMASGYNVFYSPYFYIGVGALTLGGFGLYYYYDHKTKKEQ